MAFFLTFGGISLVTNFRHAGVAKKYKRFILHKCDNRACCNPQHLFMGSMRTNMLDAYKKGRKQQPRSAHANAKLTPTQVKSIRKKYVTKGLTQQALATEYGVSQRAISLIVRYETYKDV